MMMNPLLIITALLSTIGLAYGSNTTNIQKYPTHLTLAELETLLNSETTTEFQTDSSKGVLFLDESAWDAANAYEWTKALNTNNSTTEKKYPYLVCHVGDDMSGWQRRQALVSAINEASNAEEDEEDEVYLHTLYNEQDYLCVYSQLLPSAAITFTDETLYIVQPLLASLKMIKGSVNGMREEYTKSLSDANTAMEYYPMVDIGLCPGVAIREENDDSDENESDGIKEGQSYLEYSQQIETEEENLDGVEDITEEITQLLLSSSSSSSSDESLLTTNNTTSNSSSSTATTTVLPLSQQFYMTSQAYKDHLNNNNNSTNNSTTERSQMWGDLLTKYQTSGICDETYQTRLTWKIYRTKQPERFASQMQVTYNNTGESDTDAGCALVLLLAISANPDVCSVDVRRGVQISNQIASFMVESEVPNEYPFRAKGIDGTGETVAVSDTGVDPNNCYFFDPNQPRPVGSTIDVSARKIDQYIPFVDTKDYQFGHGTHVAGTIAGARYDGGGAANGIAPGAKLAVADIGNENGDLLPPSDNALLNTGRPNAQIHSASWGSTFNFYTSRARNFDQFMFENDEFLIIVAAGNSGNDDGNFDVPNTVGDPAIAKNVIAVGAHNSWGDSSAMGNLGPSYVADFSSRGPSADGRMKPDIVAVGKAVLSAGADPNKVGECDPNRIPGPNSNGEGLSSKQGTSMATPVVSGTAAIIRQYFRDGYYPSGTKNSNDSYPNPSGALVKAVLMNGAQSLQGVDNGVNGVTDINLYDNNQGFGRISLRKSVYLAGQTDVQLKVWDRETVIDQETNTYNVTIDRSNGCQAEDLSVTLAWVEEGSSPGCMNCVLNDLDLSVSFGNKTYYPNGRDSPDRTNIVERVVIKGVEGGGTAIISVNAQNLAWFSQTYALVATGCFGGVANTLEGESVFDSDKSQQRRQIIIISICVVVGVLLIGCVTYGLISRRKARSSHEVDDDSDEGGFEERA